MTDMLTYLTRYKQKEIIVCETNIWDGTEGKYEAERTAYLTKVMKEAYYHPSKRVKGLIFYELLDERNLVEHENEAWFGLVNCDINGNIGAVKPAYKEIQKLLGGKAMDTIHVDRDSPWDDIDSPADPTVKPTTKPPAVKTTTKATGKPTSQPNTTTVTDAVSSGSGETTAPTRQKIAPPPAPPLPQRRQRRPQNRRAGFPSGPLSSAASSWCWAAADLPPGGSCCVVKRPRSRFPNLQRFRVVVCAVASVLCGRPKISGHAWYFIKHK